MNQPKEQLFNERIGLLKLVTKAYNCTVIDAGKIIYIFKDGKPVYEFTREEIIYVNARMDDIFRAVKEKNQ